MSRVNKKSIARLEAVRKALETGRAEEAWAEARRLLAARNPDPRTLNLAGIAAFQAGEPDAAADLLKRAAARAGKSSSLTAEIFMNLGNVIADDDPDAALGAYERAHEAAPSFAEPAFNAGVLLLRLGRPARAEHWFCRALNRDPGHGQASLARAEALRQTGDLNAAKEALEVLLAHESRHPAALTNLSAVLADLGEDEAALKAAKDAVAADPGLAEAHFNLGVALQTSGQTSEDLENAIASYKHALALEPRNAAAALNMGEAFLASDDREQAKRMFQRALDIDPAFAKAAINLADMALAAGDAATALTIIDRFLDQVPGHPSALAFKAFAHRDMGETEQARQLDDPDRFILPLDIEAPPGFADIAGFNEALSEHLLAHPTLVPSPRAHATRNGFHSGELLNDPLGPMAAFRDVLENAFQTYRRRHAGEPQHPFLDLLPSAPSLAVWGVVMHQAGHQVAHIHPSARLSGVYYVDVPDTVRADDPDHAGWIEFGRPPDDIHARHEPPVRWFQPRPGRLILFPSHFYHRTVPLDGDRRRISIAFDFKP